MNGVLRVSVLSKSSSQDYSQENMYEAHMARACLG